MASAQAIESYRGDPGLGLGSSPEIGVLPENPNLTAVQQTGRDLLLANVEKNRTIYQQKVKDRDTLLGLIDEGKINIGNILPDDKDALDAEFKKLEDAQSGIMNKDGTINSKGYAAYQKAYRDTNEATTMANLRYVNKTGADAESAKAVLPSIRQAIEDNTAKNVAKGLHGYWQPYQQTLDYELDPFFKMVTAIPYQDPNNPFIKGTYYDYAQAQTAMNEASLDMKDGGKLRYFMNSFFDDIQKKAHSIDPNVRAELKEQIDNVNAQLEKYNLTAKQLGKTEAKPIQVIKDAAGNIKDIVEKPSDFMAKFALAHQPKFLDITPDDKLLKLQLEQQKTQAYVGATDALRRLRNAQANVAGLKGKILVDQFNPAETFGQMFQGKMQTYKSQAGNIVTRVNVQDMSKAFLDNLGIDPLNSEGDYNVVPSNIKYKGKSVPEGDTYNMYESWLKTPDAAKVQQAKGTTPDIFDFIYANGGTFDVEVEGKVAPVYKAGKDNTGNPTRILMNKDQAGKIIRSNRLQSWINQRKGMGVKGKDLLMGEEQVTEVREPEQ